MNKPQWKIDLEEKMAQEDKMFLILNRKGYHLYTMEAKTAEEALAKAHQEDPNLEDDATATLSF